MNNKIKDKDLNWSILKTKVKCIIDSTLKEEILLEAQRIKLEYGTKDRKLLLENFQEIGKAWNMDGSIGNILKINQVEYCAF